LDGTFREEKLDFVITRGIKRLIVDFAVSMGGWKACTESRDVGLSITAWVGSLPYFLVGLSRDIGRLEDDACMVRVVGIVIVGGEVVRVGGGAVTFLFLGGAPRIVDISDVRFLGGFTVSVEEMGGPTKEEDPDQPTCSSIKVP
jgi:hypothetical protein